MNKICRKLLANGPLVNSLSASFNFKCLSTFNRHSSILNFSNLISVGKANNNTNCYGQVRFYERSSFNPKFRSGFDDAEDNGEGFKPRGSSSSGFSSDRFRPRSNFGGDKFTKFREPIKVWNEDFEDAVAVESTKQENYQSSKSFRDFDVPEQLAQRLEQLGYKAPFAIQEKTLKHSLAGEDVVGKAFTGSGKTLAFAIPIVARIMKSEKRTSRYPKCLVLSPTRELCLQLTNAIQNLAPEMKCISIVGGTGYESQIRDLNGKVDIVCATPGRLRDLMNRKNFVADDIEIICMDEADELLTPNFLDQIKDVIEMTNKKQMLMFSATINKNVHSLINKYMQHPVFVDLTDGKTQKLPANIEHFVIEAPSNTHVSAVMEIVKKFNSQRCIVFTNMKRTATNLCMQLDNKGIRCHDLHSDLSQAKRGTVLDKFRNGKLQMIIATDVASRGIDIPECDLIINLEAPTNGIDYYIHRSGRTGRAGRIGRSVLVHSGAAYDLTRTISKLVKLNKLELPEGSLVRSQSSSYDNNDSRPPRRFSSFSGSGRSNYSNNRYNNNNNDDDDDNDYGRRDNFRSFNRKPFGERQFTTGGGGQKKNLFSDD